jgi:hypothetical protein
MLLSWVWVFFHAARFDSAQIVDDNFGWAKDFVPAAVTALEDFDNRVVRLRRIIARGQGFVPVRIEELAETVFAFDAMVPQQLTKLLQGRLHALTELLGRGGFVACDRALKIVDDR